ncbi:hypothetical protein FSP39_007083 [Pinctada imbricata]|uniref:Uncharacterized protein n=1 Tax=Pinctada imbricata TaxID=66713 RepID=A0AA88YBF3_PINIB|nr:hypothetical protein FSP39_007083 [Pinctada imbricata]
MIRTETCQRLSATEIQCTPKTAIDIEGGSEWLFITRIFEVFGCMLVLLALLLHVIYLPVRADNARTPAIYILGAAGLFILAGSFVFIAMNGNLAVPTRQSEQSLGFPVGLCILAGIVAIAASVLTAVATAKKATQIDDFEYQDEEQMIKVPMRQK